jgi:GcrA cell cycle regulator
MPSRPANGKRFRERRMRQNWTDEKFSLLKILWTEGKTAVAIAQRLGVSKSAVLGKIFRLRLAPPKQRPGPTAASPMLRRKGRRVEAESLELSTKRGKSLLELTNESCRWPIGDPAKTSFHFCGEPGADLAQGIPYCERHRQRAYARPGPTEADRGQGGSRDGAHRFSPAMQTTVQRLFQVAIARRVRT